MGSRGRTGSWTCSIVATFASTPREKNVTRISLLARAACGFGLAGLVPLAAPSQAVVNASRFPGKVHVLPATLETTQWRWFDNAHAPVLTVDSGDTVVLETMMHSHNQ